MKQKMLVICVVLTLKLVEISKAECVGGSKETSHFGKIMLSAHNEFRKHENLSQLCYSKGGKGYSLNAKSWAESCIAKDLSEPSPLRAEGKIGEIINWFENREPYNELHAVLGLVDIWKSSCLHHTLGVRNDTFPATCAQLVWNNSTELNCGIAKSASKTVLVCQYYPPMLSTGIIHREAKQTFIGSGKRIRQNSTNSERKKRQNEDYDVIWVTNSQGPNVFTRKADDNRHFTITYGNGTKRMVIFPRIFVSFAGQSDGKELVWLDHDEDFRGISSFQLILSTEDDEGILNYKNTFHTYEESKESNFKLPYITAELRELPGSFFLGDGKTYGGYYNGRVFDHLDYKLRIRAIVLDNDKEVIEIDTAVLGWFTNSSVALISLGSSAVLVSVVLGCVASFFIRKRRERIRVKETIDKFNDLLRDHDYPPDQATTSRGANHVISPVPAVFGQRTSLISNNTEWWEMSTNGSNEDDLAADGPTTNLLADNAKWRGYDKSGAADMILSDTQIPLPDINMPEDEIYHLH